MAWHHTSRSRKTVHVSKNKTQIAANERGGKKNQLSLIGDSLKYKIRALRSITNVIVLIHIIITLYVRDCRFRQNEI